MWQNLWDYFLWAIGGDTDASELAIGHMMARATIVFILGIIIIRIGKRRFYGARTPLDLLMSVVVGSVLSRAINGSARFTETIVATLTLVALHWLFSTIAFHSDFFSRLVKGAPRLLIEDGEMQYDAMRASNTRQRGSPGSAPRKRLRNAWPGNARLVGAKWRDLGYPP